MFQLFSFAFEIHTHTHIHTLTCTHTHTHTHTHSLTHTQIHIIIFLIQQGADWKAVDTEGDSVLHFACMKEMKSGVHDKTLELLLNPPVVALKNKQNARGDTPIMVATRYMYSGV